MLFMIRRESGEYFALPACGNRGIQQAITGLNKARLPGQRV